MEVFIESGDGQWNRFVIVRYEANTIIGGITRRKYCDDGSDRQQHSVNRR